MSLIAPSSGASCPVHSTRRKRRAADPRVRRTSDRNHIPLPPCSLSASNRLCSSASTRHRREWLSRRSRVLMRLLRFNGAPRWRDCSLPTAPKGVNIESMELANTRVVLLEVLEAGPAYGLQIIDTVKSQIGWTNVYPTLRRMERMVFLESYEAEAELPDRGRRPLRHAPTSPLRPIFFELYMLAVSP